MHILRKVGERVVSETPKTRRQGKGQPKTRFQILLASVNYDALYKLAKERGTSMSRVVNDWLKELRSVNR
jgi:hypothetical protein